MLEAVMWKMFSFLLLKYPTITKKVPNRDVADFVFKIKDQEKQKTNKNQENTQAGVLLNCYTLAEAV